MTTMNRDMNIHILVKPIGSLCNMRCKYCFYIEKKETIYPGIEDSRMKHEVMEEFIRSYLACHNGNVISFSFQGGEPTLAGIDFFETFISIVNCHLPFGKRAVYSIQTNGITIDESWALLFKKHNFLVGISLDGPKWLHDKNRVTLGGQSSFENVIRGLKHLKTHNVEFNTLTTINSINAKHPLKVYRFLKQVGSKFLQFVPIVERSDAANNGAFDPLDNVCDFINVSPESVKPADFSHFYISIYNEWIKKDVGRIFVQMFDTILGRWVNHPAEICIFGETCGNAGVLEHNGDVYSCDHFVYQKYFLGNILKSPLSDMFQSEKQVSFGLHKQEAMPSVCRDCEFNFICNGGCPKHRFLLSPRGESGLNYLCNGYKKIFAHTSRSMRFMAERWSRGEPVDSVMKFSNSKGAEFECYKT